MSDFCHDWPVYNRVFRQAELMDRMLMRMGASASVAVRRDNGMAWYVARTRCIDCVHERQCRAWLEHAGPCGEEPEFCPNMQFFQECRPAGATALTPTAALASPPVHCPPPS
jgi:hypothetical protein